MPDSNSQFKIKGRKHISLSVCLFLIITTAIVYGQMVTHDFVEFDDGRYVSENPQVKAGFTAESVRWAFSTTHAEFWHPLTWLSLMLDTQIFGMIPGGYLATNLLLHIFSTLLLYLFFKRTTASVWHSGFVAAMFALHPLHVESVAWIAQRKDVLSTLFWMLTMLCYALYVERPGIKTYLPMLLFLVLGLMAKPMLVTLPFALLLLDYWPLDRFQASASFRSFYHCALSLIREKIPLFVVAGAASVVAYLAQQGEGRIKSLAVVSLESRVANALVSYAVYIGKMLWPFKLACFYPYPDAFTWWQVGGSVFLLLSISWFAVRFARSYPFLIVGWLWYLGTLVPVIGLVKIGAYAMADRYSYVPLIGIFIILAWGVPALLSKGRYRKVVYAGLGVFTIVLCLVMTWFQVRVWQNQYTLFAHAVEVTSDNYLAHNGLGRALKKQGKLDEATNQFFEALRIKPDFLPTYINLGSIYYIQNKTDEAITYFSKAVQKNPNLVNAHNSLGMLYDQQGQVDKAIEHFRATLAIKPEDVGAHTFLAKTLAAKGRLDEAVYHYTELLQLQPANAVVHYNLGVALENQGKLVEAGVQYSAALKINPEYADAHYNLANLMAKQGRFNNAVDHYQKTLSIDPDHTRALSNLAFVHASKKDYQKALSSLLQLAALQPDNPKVSYNIASLYAKKHQITESIQWLDAAFKAGYKNCHHIETDEDLKSIRTAEGYDDLINRYCH